MSDLCFHRPKLDATKDLVVECLPFGGNSGTERENNSGLFVITFLRLLNR